MGFATLEKHQEHKLLTLTPTVNCVPTVRPSRIMRGVALNPLHLGSGRNITSCRGAVGRTTAVYTEIQGVGARPLGHIMNFRSDRVDRAVVRT